ncbi:MAG: zf-HC2 domain-containing protein [Pseudomonadota bacterium]
MACEEIRALLSEYMDDVIDKENRARIESHLSACEGCRKELASLRALVRQMGDLDPVSPPKDFLAQLHQRLERPPLFSRILRTLFFPMRFKIPMELAGAALMAFFILYILPFQKEEYRMAKGPQALKDEKRMERTVGGGMKNQGLEKPSEPMVFMERSDVRELNKKGGPIELALVLRRAIPGAKPDAGPIQEARSQKLMASERTLSVTRAAPDAGKEEDRLMDKGALGDEMDRVGLRAVIEGVGGRVLSIEHEEGDEKPALMDAEIPAGRINLFLDRLRPLGDLTAPAEIPAGKQEGFLRVQIRLLPPT